VRKYQWLTRIQIVARGGVETEGTFERGPATVIFSDTCYLGTGQTWDVSPDGQRFLMVKPDEDLREPRLVVVPNWTEELKRLVPTE